MYYDSSTGNEIMFTYLYKGLQDLGLISENNQEKYLPRYCFGTEH